VPVKKRPLEESTLNFMKDESGASLIEYGLMLVLIMVVCFGIVIFIGAKTSELFDFSW
jgi:Flp pilus assembly pilin Flp